MKKKLKVSRQQGKAKSNRFALQCRSEVNKSLIRRESIQGVEHIIVSSYTLPDNIVMNGGLYPETEIAKSYHTLERTLAPVEHPEIDGEFLSANDPLAINDFYVGAFNQNVTRKDGRVHMDKVINVQEAMKSQKGRRLLDRLEEIETNDNARPIHTSVTLYCDVIYPDDIQVNDAGDEYSWIAVDMVFDHDAILLDSVGAAKPSQGVGIAVNSEGEKMEVSTFSLVTNSKKSNDDGLGESESDSVDGGDSGDQDVKGKQFKPNQGTQVMNLILNRLKEAGIKTEGLSDDELIQKYDELKHKQNKAELDAKAEKAEKESKANASSSDEITAAVAAAVKPLSDKVDALAVKANEANESELNELAEFIVNSKKYPSLEVDDIKRLGIEKARSMAANCRTSHGLPVSKANQSSADMPSVTCTIPE